MCIIQAKKGSAEFMKVSRQNKRHTTWEIQSISISLEKLVRIITLFYFSSKERNIMMNDAKKDEVSSLKKKQTHMLL